MLIFGLLSSVVDIALYWLLVVVFKAEPELFRSVWYIESLFSELVAMLVLRTKRSFWRSKPSAFLLTSCLVVGAIAIAVTFTPGLNTLLGFASPTLPILLAVAGLLVAYAFSNEIFKRKFMV
jgi:Mg2+-importing ATPase